MASLEEITGLIERIELSARFTDIRCLDTFSQHFISSETHVNIHAVKIPGIKRVEKDLVQRAVNEIHVRFQQCQSVLIVSASPVLNDYIAIPRESKMQPAAVIYYADASITFDAAFYIETEKDFDIHDHTVPLYRVVITDDEYVLFVTRHFVFDGRSRIPFYRDFLRVINLQNAADHMKQRIKNAPFVESLLKSKFMKNTDKHNLFRSELYAYGGAYKLFNDVRLNTGDIVHRLNDYFSDSEVIESLIEKFKCWDLMADSSGRSVNDPMLSLMNPQHVLYRNAAPTKCVCCTIDRVYNLNLAKLCKTHQCKFSIVFAYISFWCGIRNVFTACNARTFVDKNKLILAVVDLFDARLFAFDEQKVSQYFGADMDTMDIMGNCLCANMLEMSFDVDFEIGSDAFWKQMKIYSEKSAVGLSNMQIHADLLYGKEVHALRSTSKLSHSLWHLVSSLGRIDLNRDDFKYKATKLFRFSGSRCEGGLYFFGSCIKDVGDYDVSMGYYEPYMSQQVAQRIMNDIVTAVQDLYCE